MTITDIDTALTKEQLQVLRKADIVCFDRLTSGSYQVRAFRRIKRKVLDGVEVSGEREDVIPTNGTVTRYGDNRDIDSCYSSILSAQYDYAWRTIVGLLRAGDRLELKFLAGNHSENLRRAELSCDELHLVVRRGEGPRAKTLYFNVDHRICPDNSSARIVIFK